MVKWRIRAGLSAATGLVLALLPAHGAAAAPAAHAGINCAAQSQLCAEVYDSEAVFGVKDSLIRDFVPGTDGVLRCESDFVLRKAGEIAA